jgi:hypothetical protein
MHKKLIITLSFIFFSWVQSLAQFSFQNLKYFIGSGADTAMLVVDFKDGTNDSSYAWGLLFNGTSSGQAMLQAVAAADVNFSINTSGGFLNDIIYGNHQGIGGQPNFWSTWSGTDTASLSMNAGIGTTVNAGDWFALSYTDFNPAAKPGLPIAAFNPRAFTLKEVEEWIGAGTDSAVLVIDFLNQGSSYAWGVLFSDSTTGSNLLNTVAMADNNLMVNAGAFLNDLIYKQDSGIGGSPNFWGTWSATNLGNWTLNAGIGTSVKNGDFFGCSYTNFAPALRPQVPTAVNFLALPGLPSAKSPYPNPALNFITVPKLKPGKKVLIFNLQGQKVASPTSNNQRQVNITQLNPGIYILKCQGSSYPVQIQ